MESTTLLSSSKLTASHKFAWLFNMSKKGVRNEPIADKIKQDKGKWPVVNVVLTPVLGVDSFLG